MSTWQTLFHPLVVRWFTERFGEPTPPQIAAWPSIAAGKNTLVAAPTGSGKTLAAFMVCLDRLLRQAWNSELSDGIEVLYLSPLKALSNDIERNLQTPLAELRALAAAEGLPDPEIRTAVRTGDTPASERASMMKTPPHMLVTTPESLYLLLTSEKGRNRLRTVKTVIVDEIHALARDKRGSHLALSLERLDWLCETRPVRIGLSATQKPIEEIAKFLVGCEPIDAAIDNAEPRYRECEIIDGGHVRELTLAVEVPPSELSAVCSNEQWGEVYARLAELITNRRSTLVFVNTRRMAERVAHHLTELLGEEGVASHHGSLSRKIRHDAELRLKTGKLRAIVATASLEMGIDIGYIDLVCQIGSPASIAAFLQRVGRSGHSLGKVPEGRLFPLTRDELLESLALVRSIRNGTLDRIEIPQSPLDIMAQQIIAAASAEEELDEAPLFDRLRRAYSYRNLPRADYEAMLAILSEGVRPGSKVGVHLHRDRVNGKIRARKGARLTAITNGGAIPETAEYRVVTEGEKTFVGSVDEDFAIDSSAGDVFLLGGTSWRIAGIRNGEVLVNDAEGAPPTIPFWFGEGPGRTIEFSHEVSRLRRDLAEAALSLRDDSEPPPETIGPLLEQCGADRWGAIQAIRYVAAQHAALGVVPSGEDIVFERFFDEAGGMQVVIHAPLGARITRAWGLAMRKRFCRSFDFELQAAADDDGLLLSLGPQHSFPIERLFEMLTPQTGPHLLEQALLAAPMFQVRWRWNAMRSLFVQRRRGDQRVPPHMQRFRAEDLLAAAFPEQVGCFENHHGDKPIPDHPLVKQTIHDCMTEAMDLTRWVEILGDYQAGRIRFHARDTREPSPFCHEILNAAPYAFLDGAPLEERRTRAVQTRRSSSADDFRELTRLDPAAITQVTQEAWPTVRNADELHEALTALGVVHEFELREWDRHLESLLAAGRATRVQLADGSSLVCAAERLSVLRAAYPSAQYDPAFQLPAELERTLEAHEAWVELVRGRIAFAGPIASRRLAALLSLEPSSVAASLEALEAQGEVLRGRFTPEAMSEEPTNGPGDEWCDRRLLARIHRLTLSGLRKRIAPVEPDDFAFFLSEYHGLGRTVGGIDTLRSSLKRLQGFELAAGAWERSVLAVRTANYDSRLLDELFLNGELVWGRLRSQQRERGEKPNMAVLTRTVPIALSFREELALLIDPNRESAIDGARAETKEIHALLQQRGALFLQELRNRSGLLPTQLEDCLRELAALGLVTSDTFAAVRAMSSEARSSRGRRRVGTRNLQAGAGRWSPFPGTLEPIEPPAHIAHWCKVLLDRYGVVFRDLLARESAAPSWAKLVPYFRKLELRGEIRGGRFIRSVAGEQFGRESIITQLREARERRENGLDPQAWCVISAVDPLNLSGIIDDRARISANPKTAVILAAGRVIAVKQAGQIEFLEPIEGERQYLMRRALQLGRRLEEKVPERS